MDFLSYISGSDVRGQAIGENSPLTSDFARRLGEAWIAYLRKTLGIEHPHVCIGRDPRLSGQMLEESCAFGMMDAGARVTLFGLCTTPAMYMSIILPDVAADASIMVTASHLPYERNGFKFFLKDGGINSKTLKEILTLAEADADYSLAGGSMERRNFLPEYADLLRRKVMDALGDTAPLSGLHIVVDAGNGAGGFYADLLDSLGANTSGSQFLDPDGRFPNHIPNPENPQAMNAISACVTKNHADLGVIFDTDCDRAAIVDRQGHEINRNRLIALISAVLLQEIPGATIVTDSVTSTGLATHIATHGGKHHRFKRGYRNVIDEARRLCAAGTLSPLAIETSGHAALQENYFLDDGMYLVTRLIIEAVRMKRKGQELTDLIADLREPVESTEIRLRLTGSPFRPDGEAVIDRVVAFAASHDDWHVAPDNREGIRVSFDISGQKDSAWFLLRLSLHDPVLPLNIESDVPNGTRELAEKLYSVIHGMNGLDDTPLADFLNAIG